MLIVTHHAQEDELALTPQHLLIGDDPRATATIHALPRRSMRYRDDPRATATIHALPRRSTRYRAWC